MTTHHHLQRRTLLASGAALLAQTRVRAGGARPNAIARPMRCADFVDTLGVNTHISYAWSQDNDLSALIAAMGYCGLRFARDRAPSPTMANCAHYAALAAAGVNFCLFCGPARPMDEMLGPIEALEAGHPGAIDALEGPNEIEPTFAYAGATGTAAAVAFMTALRAAAGRRRILRDKPLVNFTGYSRSPSDCDVANIHLYPKGGDQPGPMIGVVHDRWIGPAGVMAGKRMVFTEFGYHTLVGKPANPLAWQGVDEETQAVLLVNGWLDAAATGILRLYIYQLFDGVADRPGAPNMQNHFGLFRVDGTPKPAAVAIRMLSALLADPSPNARDFAPAPTPARVDFPDRVSVLPLQNATGRHFLVFWNETPVWDGAAASPLPARPAFASVTLPQPAAMRIWEVGRNSPPTDIPWGSSALIRLVERPVVLRIG
jgi:hypothetical protein